MRLLESYNTEQDATKVSSALLRNHIESHVRIENNIYSVWIEDEDLIPMAQKIVQDYKVNPNSANFQQSTIFTKTIAKPPIIETRRVATIEISSTLPLLTYFVIALCVLLFAVEGTREALMFSPYHIQQGEYWRLLTPIFLHGGMLHLIFNMMWMYQLGAQIEQKSGFWSLLAMLIIMGIVCNVGQFLVSGPNFVGLSGVVYGLLGFIWAKQKWETNSQFFLPDQTMGFMMIWLVICVIGIIPNVANTHHVLGVIQGTALGYLTSGHLKTYLRRRKYKSKL